MILTKLSFKVLLSMTLGLALVSGLCAQSSMSNKTFETKAAHFEYFKSVPLIVRLNMKQKTIDTYKQKMESASSEKLKKHFEEEYEETKRQRKMYEQYTLEAFKRHYDYSKFYFIHDHDYGDFNAGKPNLLFDAEKKVVNFDFGSEFILLKQGMNDVHWIMESSEGIPFPKSFPSEIRTGLKSFEHFFSIFFGEPFARDKDIYRVVEKLNNALKRYETKLKSK